MTAPRPHDGAATPVGRLGVSAATRLAVALAAGLAAGWAGALAWGWQTGVPAGWCVGAAVFVVWLWLTIRPMGAVATAEHAAREDPGRATAHVIVLAAAVASLGAVALLLAAPSSVAGGTVGQAALSVGSVALAWAAVHVAFTTRYAHLYYTGGGRPIDFGETKRPRYTDFAYLAFTVGMTFQVSDTQLRSSLLRAVVLRHALFSYLLGVVVIAATINLVAGLGG